VFHTPVTPLKGYTSNLPIGPGGTSKLADKKGKSPQVFSTHRTPLSALPTRHPVNADDSTDNDPWVDTDADGSEVDLNSESDVQNSPTVGLTDI
jgi:hypothetical protein